MSKRSKLTWIERRAHSSSSGGDDDSKSPRAYLWFILTLALVFWSIRLLDLFSEASKELIDELEPVQVQREILHEPFNLLSELVTDYDYHTERESIRRFRRRREPDIDLYSPGVLHAGWRTDLARLEDVEWTKVLQVAQQDTEMRAILDEFFSAANVPIIEQLAQLPERDELRSFSYTYTSEQFGDLSLIEYGVHTLREIHGDRFKDTLPEMPSKDGEEWLLKIHAMLLAADRVLMYTTPDSWRLARPASAHR